jgi:hypothetical protein
MDKTSTTILRWIAVLPASVIGSMAAHLIGSLYSLINSGGYSWYTGSNAIGVVEVILFAFQCALTGATFVAAGWYVAPSHKKAVRTVLATVVACICILSVALAIITNTDTWDIYISAIATIAGAIYAAYNLNL